MMVVSSVHCSVMPSDDEKERTKMMLLMTASLRLFLLFVLSEWWCHLISFSFSIPARSFDEDNHHHFLLISFSSPIIIKNWRNMKLIILPDRLFYVILSFILSLFRPDDCLRVKWTGIIMMLISFGSWMQIFPSLSIFPFPLQEIVRWRWSGSFPSSSGREG